MSSPVPTERQRSVARTLRDRGPLAPPTLRARIEAQVASRPERRRAVPRRLTLGGAVAAALAAIGLVLSTADGGDLTVDQAILDKAGVSSRGELVAKLFAESYVPLQTDPSTGQAVNGNGSRYQ